MIFKKLVSYTAVGFAVFVAMPTVASSDECLGVCGDLNGNFFVTSADIINLVHWVGWTGYTAAYVECGDVDGYANLNLRDLHWMVAHVFYDDGPECICPADSGQYAPLPNADAYLIYNNVYPRGETSARVQVDLLTTRPFRGVSLLFRVKVGGVSATFAPFDDTWSNTFQEQHWTTQTIVGNNIHGRGTDGLSGVWATFSASSYPPGRYPLAWFDVIMPASFDYRPISIELFELSGIVNDAPMMVDSALVGWALTPDGYIVDPPGDVNMDRVVTSSDIIYSVNYCFKGGAWPLPHIAAADANCSETMTSADIIYLVNYVFKNGPPPCDINTDCTLHLENYTWSCP